MDTPQPEELLAGDLSVAAVAREYLGKDLPIDVRTDIYGSDDPLERTLKEQLLHIIGVSYYLNPVTGNDNNDGSAEHPWRTLAYAFEQVFAMQGGKADPAYINLILQDGVYTGEGQTYVTLGKHYQDPSEEEPEDINVINQMIEAVTIRNVRIKAQNKWTLGGSEGAILDGGWPPSLVDGDFYQNIETAYFDNVPSWAPNRLGEKDGEDEGGDRFDAILYNRLLQLINCSNVVIDGLRVQNSIGAGIYVSHHKYPASDKTNWPEVHSHCSNITIRNCRIDWCHFGAIKIDWDQEGSIIENNVITRGAFDWWINQKPTNDRTTGRAGSRYGPMGQPDKDKPNWGAVVLWANDAKVIGNVCAYSYGEVASRPRSKGALVADNKFGFNSNNCYLEGLQDATVHHNLLFCLPNEADFDVVARVIGEDSVYASSRYLYRRGKCFATANENRNHWCFGNIKNKPWKGYAYCGNVENDGDKVEIVKHLNDDLRVYNNLLLYGQADFRAVNDGKNRPITRLYFGHNTIVAAKNASESILTTSTNTDATIGGMLENNVWDNRLNESIGWTVNKEGAGIANTLRIRNNIFPTQAPDYLKLENDNVKNVYDADGAVINVTNAPQLSYGEAALPIQPPATNLTNAQMDSHLDDVLTTLKDKVHWFDLNGSAVAIDSGSIEGAIFDIDTDVLTAARAEDYFGNNRDGKPDIGAVEYGA